MALKVTLIAFTALLLLAGSIYLYSTLPKPQAEQTGELQEMEQQETGKEHVLQETIYMQGILAEQQKKCGEYVCFKIKVINSSDFDLVNSTQTIKTEVAFGANPDFPIEVYATKKEGFYYATQSQIFQADPALTGVINES